MDDLISRKSAIEALGEEPEVWSGKDEYEQGLNNQWHYDITAIEAVPSERSELDEWCTDCKEYDQERHCCPRWNRVIRNTVEELKADHRWIPVTERLPEEEQYVLVTVHFKGVRDNHGGWNAHIKPTFYVDIANRIDDHWSSYSDEYKVARTQHEVVAWMPLPDPWKEES